MTKDEKLALIARVESKLRLTKIVCTRSVNGANGATFVGFSAAYLSTQEDIGMGTDLSTVMDDAEVNLQGLQAMTLEEARVSELLLGRHVAQAAFGQAYATGGISESRYVDEIKGLQSKYSQALSGALEKLAAKEGL